MDIILQISIYSLMIKMTERRGEDERVLYHGFMQKTDVLIEMFVDLINLNQWLIIYTD